MFISVIPALRTPFGVDAFDYRVADHAALEAGDLIMVPFRRRQTPALVAALSLTSQVAARAVTLTDVRPLIRFPRVLPELLTETAQHVFSSRPSLLTAWLRHVPKRQGATVDARYPVSGNGALTYLLKPDRERTVIARAKESRGRVLILTPWRKRAERYAEELDAAVLHADLADGAAWRAWTSFLDKPRGILVATRIGAWLSAMATTVILDEPENDDFKQDELAPRYDARFIVIAAKTLRPDLELRAIGVTPTLASFAKSQSPRTLPASSFLLPAPLIDVPLITEPWQRRGGSGLAHIPETTRQRMEAATEDGRPVIVLHPIRGERARFTCRDCEWTAACEACGFALSRTQKGATCRRCGHMQDVPITCPSCGGADLEKSRLGKDALMRFIKQALPHGDIRIVDLGEWHALELPQYALVVVTDASLIGGYVEDIRRRERLAISWRRLAASVASVQGELIIHGPEELLPEMRGWLTPEGLERAWSDELRERKAFGYPPAVRLAKILFDSGEEEATRFADRLRQALPESWQVRGPWPVPYRLKSRRPRFALHAIAPKGDTALLQPFASEALIDLDPIAFFS